LSAVVLVLLVVVAAGSWLLLELFRQQGRILLRLDSMDGHPVGAGAQDGSRNGNGKVRGLPVGSPAPAFELAAVDGGSVSLGGLRSPGLPVLLVFSDPGCGPCNALLPEIGDWQRDHAERLTIALVSRGSIEANQEKSKTHELSRVLLQKDREVAKAYAAHGTPSAILISPDGQIASALAGGPPAIRELLTTATSPNGLRIIKSGEGPQNGGAPPPAGLPVGTAAPDFELADLDGKPVTKDTLDGAPATLIFWNPGCGFCQRLLPDLRSQLAASETASDRVLLVSSGSIEENRALDLAAAVTIDEGFSVGSQFAARGTPSAVTIDAQGKVATPLATGGPAVLSLLSDNALATVQ
jgi:peroxiredoxin